jgi:hypothetical protein
MLSGVSAGSIPGGFQWFGARGRHRRRFDEDVLLLASADKLGN